MRWQGGIGIIVFIGLLACTSLFGLPSCSPANPTGDAVVTIQASKTFIFVGEEISLTVQGKDKEGKVLPKDTDIEVSATRGSFRKGTNTRQITVKIADANAAILTFYAEDVPGPAVITAQSQFTESSITIFIQEKDNTEQPDSEPSAEKETEDGGVIDQGEQPIDVEPDNNISNAIILKIELVAKSERLKADGADTTEITGRILEPANLPPSELNNLKLIFRTTMGTLLDPETNQPFKPLPKDSTAFPVPYVRGTFRVILKSDVRAGTAQVEAGISDEFYYGRAEIKINIVELGFIEFEKVEPRTIGTQGSGKEVATVSVKVRDTNNEPFPQGTRVHFSLTNPIGGASITTSEAVTNDQGIASTQVKSGRLVGAVTVKAQVTFNAPPSANCPASCSTDEHCNQCGYKCHLGVCKKILEAISPSIAIVGGRPSYRGLTFYCGDRNIGALHGRIGSNIVSSINTECTVILADRFSNKVGVSTQVLFMAEGGAIDASSATKDFLGGGGGGATGDVGVAKASIRSQNPEPADVPPMSVENVNNCQDSQCTQPKPGGFWIPYNCTNKLTDKLLYVEPWYTDEFGRVRNPRDGLITVIAYTNGEEQFTDLNNNGIYDEGEPFVDLGEPFIDINDNGKWDAWLPGYPNGEPFIDMPCTAEQVTKKLNGCTQVGVGNGKWDGPNGKWDADTLIWKKTWILWTGCATMMGNRTINGAVDLRSCTHIPFQSGIYMAPGLLSPTPANLNQFTQSGTFVVDPAKPATVKLLWHDENLNPVIPSATGSYTADGVKMTQSPSTNDLNRNTTGFSFEAHTRLLSPQGSIFQEELEIIPTSFWGVNPGRLFSHLLFLEDSDGKKADDPANADVKIQLQIGTPPIGCTVSATIMGLSY